MFLLTSGDFPGFFHIEIHWQNGFYQGVLNLRHEPTLHSVADDGKARLPGQLAGQVRALQDFCGGGLATKMGVVYNACDLLAAFGLDALQGLPQGLFQTVELWIPNAKAGPAPNDLWDRTGCIWLYSGISACSFGARASSRGRAWDWVQVQERSSGSSQGSRAMAPFSQSTR